MSHPIRSLAASGCALIVLVLAAPASAATVTPHVFDGGLTLADLANENLDPWGFYDGTKGLPVSGSEAGRRVAAADPVPGDWVAAAGWSAGGGDDGANARLAMPSPVPSGFTGPRVQSPCFWGNPGFGRAESRDRCGHPVRHASGAGSRPGGVQPLQMPLMFIGASNGAGGGAAPVPVTMPVPGPERSPVPVPLPATGFLLAAGLLALGYRKRR